MRVCIFIFIFIFDFICIRSIYRTGVQSSPHEFIYSNLNMNIGVQK